MKENIRIHLPGILLLALILIIGLATYQDYGTIWDAPDMRLIGTINYYYIYNNDPSLLTFVNKDYGPGFELVLMLIEKKMNITDTRDIYLMRHIANHIFFFISICFFYVMAYRLFQDRFLACLCLLMLALAPRIYAHSFFNSRDIPFLSATVITLSLTTVAFQTRRLGVFLVAGLFCGFAAGIRVMGIMVFGYIIFFLLIDVVRAIIKKENKIKPVANMLAFAFAFCLSMYAAWPYLWGHPIAGILDSFKAMSHFRWVGTVFLDGTFHPSDKLPWFLFPVWFLVTNPALWLVAGFAGIIWLCIDLVKKPAPFFLAPTNRIFLLCLLCFFTPILAIIGLHAVIYEDWRHLFFVYPSFIILAMYCISKLYHTRFRVAVQVATVAQVAITAFTMYRSFPLNNVYFNPLVSHSSEYLRNHYEMDYWGASCKLGLDYLIHTDQKQVINVAADRATYTPLESNIMLLTPRDRQRIRLVNTPEEADYFFTDFRTHPQDYDYPVKYYSFKAFNSTILQVYKLR